MKAILPIAAVLLTACGAKGAPARISIDVPQDALQKQIIAAYSPYDAPEGVFTTDTITIENTHLELVAPDADKTYVYNVSFGINDGMLIPDIYVGPDETAVLKITDLDPFDYILTGTPLVEGINAYDAITLPIQKEFLAVREAGGSPATLRALYNSYIDVTRKFIDTHLDNPAAAYALSGLEGQDFITYYEKLTPYLSTSIFKDYLDEKKSMVEKELEHEKHVAELANGSTMAPGFTLKDLNGKDVSLDQYRGKWVVLDFWGSWCIWCIKGFPELKANYDKYAGRLEVIGIDNGDTPDQWKAAVAKYELPWVNVYNPKGNEALLQQYDVQGFPTKAIINPEGKLVNLTTGEDPSFYEKLAEFMGL